MKKIYIQIKTEKQMLIELDQGHLSNFLIEDRSSPRVGDIFSGIVKKIDPRLNIAFVHIGYEELAYFPLKKDDKIHQGERVIVQVTKLPIKSKRISVTNKIEITNEFFVYLPFENGIHISNKIDLENHKRLMDLFKNFTSGGLIIRTACEFESEQFLLTMFETLKECWGNILNNHNQGDKPQLLYRNESVFQRYLSTINLHDYDEIVCDDIHFTQQLKQQFSSVKDKFNYDRRFHMKKPFPLEMLKEKLTSPIVKLKNGANITINRSEALTLIDVDSAGFRYNKNKENMILEINKEAAKEIASIIKQRQLSGIILIDFINMKRKSEQQQVIEVLTNHLKDDLVPHVIYGFTKLGLLEMTRKRAFSDVYEHFLTKSELMTDSSFNLHILEEKLLYYQAERVDAVHLEVKRDLTKWKEKIRQFQDEHQFSFSLFISVNSALQTDFELYKIGDVNWLLQRMKERQIKVDNLF